MPRGRVPELLVEIQAAADRHGVRVATFGHAGDGNLHPNFIFDHDDPRAAELTETVRDEIFAAAIALGGTVTAEHGIGLSRRDGARRPGRPGRDRRDAHDQGRARSARDPEPGPRDLGIRRPSRPNSRWLRSQATTRAERRSLRLPATIGVGRGRTPRRGDPVGATARIPAMTTSSSAPAVCVPASPPPAWRSRLSSRRADRRRSRPPRLSSDRRRPLPSVEPAPPVSATPEPSTPVAATSPTVAEVARLQASSRATRRRRRPAGPRLRPGPARPRDGRPVPLRAGADAFEAALRLDPDDATALVGRRRPPARQARVRRCPRRPPAGASQRSPSLVAAHAVEVDALVELGRYDDADQAAGEMLGLRADLSTLARVSYLAELHGHLPAALTAMRAGGRGTPGLGPGEHGVRRGAARQPARRDRRPSRRRRRLSRRPSPLVPDHAPSLAGRGPPGGRRRAISTTAIALFERAAAIVPLPEYVIALGDAQAAAGQHGRCRGGATTWPGPRSSCSRRPASSSTSISPCSRPTTATRADALGPRRGRLRGNADGPRRRRRRLGAPPPRPRRGGRGLRSTKALRLGSVDPLLRYHAGAIEAALGEPNDRPARPRAGPGDRSRLLRDGRRRGPPAARHASD